MKTLSVVASLIVLVSSCTGTKEPAPPPTGPASSSPLESIQPVTDVASFVAALEAAGHTVRAGRTKELSGFEGFGVPGRRVSLDGVRVWAFEYPSIVAFDRLRSSISKSGHTVGNVMIDWPPHIYGAGRLIVVHAGNRQGTIRTLDQLLGPPFAGS